MRGRSGEPERWSSRTAGGQAAEDRFGEGFRTVAGWSEPSAQLLERGRRTLQRPRTARGPGMLRTAAVAIALLAGGGGAVWATRGVWRSTASVRPLDDAREARRARASGHHPGEQPAPPVPAPENVSPAIPPATSSSPSPATRPSALPPSPATDSPAPGSPAARAPSLPRRRLPEAPLESEAPAEAVLLADAFRKLRADHDGAGALERLDEHARRFPLGDLHPEAAAARVEALMLLGRQSEALDTLELMPETAGPPGERAVVRGELRAALGRCQDALTDFERVLASTPPPDLAERGLRGRASCRAQLADVAGARTDLRRYLLLYPRSPFADEARRALQTPAP